MKSFLKNNLLFIFFFFFLAGTSFAKTAYVTDELQFMVRTGKDTTHKIIAIARSGDKVEVLENDGDWTYVRFGKKEGWMLGRFIVPDPPGKVRMAVVEAEFKRFKEEFSLLEQEVLALREENGNLNKVLNEKKGSLEKVTVQYEKLQEEASSFLSLKEEAEKIRLALDEERALVKKLDTILLERNIKMFALGVAVLLLGMILGLSMRKKTKSGYY